MKIPKTTPTISAIQSCISVLRPKEGWRTSIMPPKATAYKKTGISPMRPVRASGKARAAKATMCKSLSLPSGAGGGWSSGQSMAIVRMAVTISVRGISRYLRIMRGYWSYRLNATSGYKRERLLEKWDIFLSYVCGCRQVINMSCTIKSFIPD